MKWKIQRQIIIMSKYALIGLFTQCLLAGMLLANTSIGQKKSLEEIYVEVNWKNVKVKEAFSALKSESGFSFTYFESGLDTEKMISLKSKKISMAQVLRKISAEADLQFKRVNSKIYVKRKERELVSLVEEITIQQFRVSGKVISTNGEEPLPGVSILIKGTSTGTTTDMNGDYSLQASEGDILQFSFIGYKTQEIEVGNQTTLNIILVEDLAQLEEVVVVGYGTQKKSDLTGAVGSLSSETIKNVPMNSFEQAIQGRLAGVQVNQANAAPGGGLSVRIRGANSITGNSEPLYVIDGIPIISDNSLVSVGGAGGSGVTRNFQNALSSLNPNDIANIEVLKDASASAIYGSRGANGVVIITTKKGERGKPQISFDTYFGVQSISNDIELLGTQDFETQLKESYTNAGQPVPITDLEFSAFQSDGGFNYYSDLLQSGTDASMQNYQLSFSGLEDSGMNYYISGSYFNQDGIIKSTNFERYALRVNLEKSFEKLKIGTNLTLSRTESDLIPTDGIRGVVSSAFRTQPIFPLTNEDGQFFYETAEGNPMPNSAGLLRGISDELVSDRLLGSFYVGYEIAQGLNFKTTLGIDTDNRLRETYYDRNTGPFYGGTSEPGLANQSSLRNTQVISTTQLNYQRVFNDKHTLNLTGVFEAQTFQSKSNNILNRGFASDALGASGIASGQKAGGPTIGNRHFEWSLASWVGRATYNYAGRYLITASVRSDGSSKFGEGNKWGTFPSIALGWKLNNEAFLQDIDKINLLKLRASYGITGNQEIGILQSRQRIAAGGGVFFGGVASPTASIISIPNPNLQWEQTTQLNVGIDAQGLNKRLGFSLDYYVKTTEDLLLAVELPQSQGFNVNSVFNIGEVENRGIEVSVNATLIENSDLSLNVSANFTRNRNEVIAIDDQPERFGSIIDNASKRRGNLIRPGEPLGLFYGYLTDGVYASQEEADADIPNSVFLQEAGEYKYVDVNGDGEINSEDQTILGDPNPDFIYGFSINSSWKSLSLALDFQGSQGNDILWNDAYILYGPGVTGNNVQERFDGRWTPTNTNATYPKYNVNATDLTGQVYDSRLIFDGSFMRLRNVTLAYQVPVDKFGGVFSNLRVYGSATNLFTLTDYPGFNPEVNSFGQSSSNTGIDIGTYPLAKTFIIGINASF